MNRAHVICLAVLLVGLAGCGGPARVSGNVTLDGKPLTKGAITFAPTGDGPVATGSINSSGRYTLQVGTQSAIPPGTYTVTIVAVEPVPPTPEHPEPLPKLLTPAKYNNPATSGLAAEVKRGSNSFDYQLISEP
jgi:hypothetical protein